MVTTRVPPILVRRWLACLLGAVALACAVSPVRAQDGTSGEWRVNGGDSGFTRYAPLDQINADTVHDLEIVWRRPAVDTTLHARWPGLQYSNNLRSTPVMVGGVLYASNGIGIVEAFDPASGETIWVQELPFLGDKTPRGAANRGVGYWEDDGGAKRRILSVRPPYLLATDVETGRLVQDFGDAGAVDLRVYADTPELVPYSWSSPPLVVRDVVIVGSAMQDHPATKEQRPGYVRAYDVRTGELRWTWNPIPRAGEPGVETWLDDSWAYSGMANVWTMMSADEELGLVYLPTGAPTNDMYGGHRPGNNLFANSLVCVRAETGEPVWHFQMVHHDLWDYDNNVAPILMDITVDGREIKAVVQLTKQAMVYVFDRVTGEPVWPIVERPVPGSQTPGEWIAPTQPFPTKPAPFDVHGISVDTLTDLTPELREEAMAIAAPYVLGQIFHAAVDPRRRGRRPEGHLAAARLCGRGRVGRRRVRPPDRDALRAIGDRHVRGRPDSGQPGPDERAVHARDPGVSAGTAGVAAAQAALRADHRHRHEHRRARVDGAQWRRPAARPPGDRAPRPAAAGSAGPCDDVADEEPVVRQRGRPDHGQDAARLRARCRQEVSRLRQGVWSRRLGDHPPGWQHRVTDHLHARRHAVHRVADRLAGQGR